MSMGMNNFFIQVLNACFWRQTVNLYNSSMIKLRYLSIVTIFFTKREYMLSSVGIFYNDQYRKQLS